MKYTIATLASHSCLQILKGAKDEGFKTLAISDKDKQNFYRRFPFIDEIVTISNNREFFSLSARLGKKNIIIVPHGSFVAYLDRQEEKKIPYKYFGNKKILDIEADRKKQHDWLKESGLLLPKIFNKVKDVDRPVIIKHFGAKGGYGYTIATSKQELTKKVTDHNLNKTYVLQEYVIGVPCYFHYFYSILDKTLELMGIDRRYETNIDGIGRIPAYLQSAKLINPSFTVIGNFPIVLRESLLPQVYQMGEKVVQTAKKLVPDKGLYGPFCLETIITSNQKIYCIEISCRIVAGTNLYINGSPYTDLIYNEPMSSGRRIAREIKKAIKLNRLKEILD